MSLNEVKRIVLNRFKLIILVGVFGAVCAAGFKYCFTPLVTAQKDFVYNRIIQVENATDYSNPNFEFDYTGMINTNSSLLKLIKDTDGTIFNFNKINSAWKRTDDLSKVDWLRKRLRMHNYHDNVFEIVFTVPSSNIYDLPYLEKNAEAFMDSLVSNGNAFIREVKPHTVIKNVKSTLIAPRIIKNDKTAIAARYAIYGFIAGVFLSIAVLIGIPLFKEAQE